MRVTRVLRVTARPVIAERAIESLSDAALRPGDNAQYFSTGGSRNFQQLALIVIPNPDLWEVAFYDNMLK